MMHGEIAWRAILDVVVETWPYLLASALVAAAGVGLLARHRQRESTERRATHLRSQDDVDRHLFEVASRLETDNRHLQQLLTRLPDFIKQLNGDLDKRNIAPLLMNFVDYLFEPRQMMILYPSEKGNALVLARKKGLAREIDLGYLVTIGSGRIGWVAEYQMSMTSADFQSRRVLPSASGEAMRSFERRMDLCVPMVHDGKLKGVIAVAELGRRPPNEKRMLRMVADLGSIALNTAALLRAAELAANSDAMTKLFNKRFLLKQLGLEIAKARESGEPLSILFFDIDHFKNYNDVNGHQSGDQALKITGRLLTEVLREDDIPARYGGEEFVVLLPNTTKLGAFEAGEKIRAAVESFDFPHGRSQPGGRVTISGGVATYGDDGRTVEELLDAADAALYAAKRAGRNRVLLYEIGVLQKQTQA